MAVDISTQPRLLSRMNEREVLKFVQTRGPQSRAELTRASGLTAPTVSKAVASLLQAGLLEEETELTTSGRGRPATRLRTARKAAQVLGIVIDAVHCQITAAGLDGALHEERVQEVPTPSSYRGLMDVLARQAKQVMDQTGVRTLGIGISMPGQIDDRRQQGVLSPNLPQTDGHAPSRDLAQRLGVDCVLLQESHALCLAERYHGRALGLDDFALLDVSTGIGLGVMSGGRLLAGHSGLAGEIGHITVIEDGRRCACGNQGCLETVAGDAALAWRVSRRLGRTLTTEQVIQLVQKGKLSIDEELAQTCRYLAIGLASVINLFNPAKLFVHGRLFELDNRLFARLVDQVRRRSLAPSFNDCSIEQAQGSKLQGALAGIIQHLNSSIGPSLHRDRRIVETTDC